MFSSASKIFAAATALSLGAFVARAAAETKPTTLASPDGKMVVRFQLDAAGSPRYAIQFDGQAALAESRLDKLVTQFKDLAPEFWQEYQSARLVVDIRAPGKPDPATPTPAPQPA
jgi:hypothetical protein